MTSASYLEGFRALVREQAWPDLTTPAELLDRWSAFVASAEDGYRWSIYDQSNELSARDLLESVFTDARTRTTPEAQQLLERVMAVDARYRALLRNDVTIGHEGDPWWRRGVLRAAGPDYVDDLSRIHGIRVDLL